MQNLVLNLFYHHELGNRTGKLCVCSSMLRASEACNFMHMIVPVERDWVLKVVVSAVGLDAAQTAGTHRVGLRAALKENCSPRRDP